MTEWKRQDGACPGCRGGDEAKFWLALEVAVAESFGSNAAELNALIRIVRQERSRIERAWNEYFSQVG